MMKQFLLILLFAKTVLLTPYPVSFESELEIAPAKPLKAITSGAEIQIQVTSMIAVDRGVGILKLQDAITEAFPSGTINAHLFSKSGKEIVLGYNGFFSFAKNDVWLTLSKEGGMPTNMEFVKIVIESKVPLKDVNIYWKNHKM